MNTKLYVGNLPFDSTDKDIEEYFSPFGAVSEIKLVLDRETGRPRGFAFVEMADAAGMQSVIDELDGKEFNGRSLKINEARPREPRSYGGGGGGGGDRGGYKGDNNRKGGGGSRKGGRDRW